MKLKFCVLIYSLSLAAILGIGGCGGSGDGGGNGRGSQSGTVSGTLLVGEGQVLDGDTNDPNDPVINNDTLPGQSVPVPVTVGGYANQINDEFDVYRINIPGPITIVLSIADPAQGDLDLLFTDTNANVIKQSVGTGSFEIIDTDPGNVGEFLVVVQAFGGASNYVLFIGISTAGGSSLVVLEDGGGYIPTDAEFVPNQVIVKPKGGMDEPEITSIMSSVTSQFGMAEKASSPSGAVLMELTDSGQSNFTVDRHSTKGFSLSYKTGEEREKARTLEMVKELRRNPGLEYAEPNYMMHAAAVPDDEFFGFQWHYPLINLPQAWDITTGSDSVVVAVIDTGVVTTHPDLAGRLLRDGGGNLIGFDFISDPTTARDGDGIDPDPFDNGDLSNGSSSSFHGTHVSGTVGADTDNATGVAGVTWGGKIMPIRALGLGGSGTIFDIAEGVRFAAGLPNVSGTVPPITADVINMSLGGPGFSQTFQDAVTQARGAGVVVVASAGNNNSSQFFSPAGLNGVVSVSAVDINRQKAQYSNFGTTVDVAAPGGDTRVDRNGDGLSDGVLSTLADDSASPLRFNYKVYQGTSMAAPHVAGVVALMLSVNPTLTPDDLDLLLAGTHPDPNAGPITQDLGASGRDDVFGHGLIDAFLAVNVARNIQGGGGGTPPPAAPALTVSPESLSFGAATATLQLTISNAGTGQLQVNSITDDASWLDVAAPNLPAAVDAANPLVLTVAVDRSGLTDGTFLGNISVTSNGGNESVPVFLQVQSNVVGGDVGTVFVLVVDPDTLTAVGQTAVSASQGYTFQTPQVPTGAYSVVAGTDRDNDGFICDNGEACGIFPLIDSPAPVDVDGNESNIDFPVSYNFFSSTSLLLRSSQADSRGSSGLKRLD